MFDHPRIVVGVDFGTYGSGAATLNKSKANDEDPDRKPTVLNSWPGQPVASPKNLTALLIGSDRQVLSWGYEARRRAQTQVPVPDGPRYFSAFKMGLMARPSSDQPESSAPTPADDEDAEGSTPPPGEGAEVAVACHQPPVHLHHLPEREQAEALIEAYLRRLVEAVIEEVQNAGYSASVIRWCLTVPAIWTDEQKQTMRELAIKAGMPAEEGRLILALEPEAAAHYARTCGVNVAGRDGAPDTDLTTPGCRFVVADCGGGTADLTAYEIEADGRMAEAALPTGGPHGSDAINRAFRDRLLVDRYGKTEIIEELAEHLPEALLDIMETWERAKLDFRPGDSDPIYIPIPAAIDRRLGAPARKRLSRKQDGVSNAIVVTAAETVELFDTVVPDILDLIDGQLKQLENVGAPDAPQPVVLLVGGFSASRYLQHAVREHVGARAQVLVPPDPGAAVLFGAAQFAYEPRTRARRSRLTYGVHVNRRFREGIDPESTRFITSDGVTRCNARFARMVTRGDLIDTETEVSDVFRPTEPTTQELTLDLYSSRDANPTYVTDEGCQKIGSIDIDLAKVMAFAHKDRDVTLYLRFGETQLRARAVVNKSGEEAATTVRFLPA
ncbi:Hsp70 family protein [Streptomyces sp. NPDC085460]|uniref:Hsp70 family protein n=1 Tax=Streptomyces sp. NPDC085460 TaxID=3365723 RepID=UPI0037D017B4